MVYVDTDRRCAFFFASDETQLFVDAYKQYEEQAAYRFHRADFSEEIEEKEADFDLLVSPHAGFTPKYCHNHLKPGGNLLANNSQSNASLAYAYCVQKNEIDRKEFDDKDSSKLGKSRIQKRNELVLSDDYNTYF